jgi:hypothetical protein
VSFYLSADTSVTSQDVLLGTFPSAGLAPHTSSNSSNTVTIPTMASGQYYVGAIINFPDANSANNIVYDPTPITIDSPFAGNLVPALTANWSEPVVSATTPGGADVNSCHTADGIYISWAEMWQSQQSTPVDFQTDLYVDGALRTSWITPAGTQPNQASATQNFYLGALSEGQHQITITVDSNGAVPETNENDNSYTKTITVIKPVKKKRHAHGRHRRR